MTTWLMRGPVSWRMTLIWFAPFRFRDVREDELDLIAHQRFVRIRAKARHVRDLRPAILDRHARAIRHVGEIAEESFERDLLLLHREDMQGCEIAWTEIWRMRHAGRAVCFG